MNEPAEPTTESSNNPPQRRSASSWLKRIGLVGFLFYLIKGLLWIIIPALVAKGCL